MGRHDRYPVDSLMHKFRTQDIKDPDWCRSCGRVSLFIGDFQILEQVKVSVLKLWELLAVGKLIAESQK